MITSERFKLALSLIDGAQWRAFEQLATVFLSAEFTGLRPLAAASGDGGFDAEIFVPNDEPTVALQFSVRKDWEAKVRQTCERLKDTSPDTTMLVFATNQEVGPKAVALKKSIRKEFQVFVDVRDKEWFLTHRNDSTSCEAEAEIFSQRFADPALQSSEPLQDQARALDDLEAKAAFVYLGLQWQDDTREKGLTRLCFEAMVRAVLRETDNDNRISRADVRERIGKLLPAQDVATRDAQTDGALKRLSKVYIRHWKKVDEFCLTHAERERLRERLSEMAALDAHLRRELRVLIARISAEDGSDLADDRLDRAVELTRSVLERILLDRGEAFASAVAKESGPDLRFEDVEAVVYADLRRTKASADIEPRTVSAAVLSLMASPPEDVQAYLRGLADTYTLFAFMRETPDVQSAVVKIFSDGDIWLDTSVVLPLFAEDLLTESTRNHSNMIRAAAEVGLKLFVTWGVVEELATHINRCKGYYNALSRGDARGADPFILSCYRLSGRPLALFERWLETFCGSARPEDDIAEYLSETFGISVVDLDEYAQQAPDEVRAMVSEVWHEARDHRDARQERLGLPPMDSSTRAKLVAHDVENYLGAQFRRQARNERRSAFGWRTWFLTLDGTAFRIARELEKRLEARPLPSPAISPDFMLHYLSVGPVRARLSRKSEETLPLMLNMSILDAVPQDLLDLSDALRKELHDLPPHVVRRKIRDTLDDARLLLGPQAAGGESKLTDDIKSRLISEARQR